MRARLRQIEPSTGTEPPASPVAEPRGTTGARAASAMREWNA